MAMPAALKPPLGQIPEELCSLQFAEVRRGMLEEHTLSSPLSDATNRAWWHQTKASFPPISAGGKQKQRRTP